jgi:hypothetical protein
MNKSETIQIILNKKPRVLLTYGGSDGKIVCIEIRKWRNLDADSLKQALLRSPITDGIEGIR